MQLSNVVSSKNAVRVLSIRDMSFRTVTAQALRLDVLLPSWSAALCVVCTPYFVTDAAAIEAAAVPAVVTTGDVDGEPVYVEINRGKLRAQPQHWAPAVEDLKFGDRLIVVSRQDGWVAVKSAGGQQGGAGNGV